MSTILAFDQSSHVTGWACFKDNQLVHYGKFSLEDEDIGVRLMKFRIKVEELVDTYSPDRVIFEDIQEQKNILTFKVLAEVYGVMSELLSFLKVPYNIIPSVTWKSSLGIKGKGRQEQKQNAQTYVMNTYGVTATQDECDAICLGAAYQKSSQCAW